jgi:DHA2 family multidrug resistance protein-like MFS transporter
MSTATIHPDGLPTPQRYWSIAAIWLAILMAVLDGAIANVALPTIGHQLHAAPAESIWVVNAYQLAITVSLLPLAALGDIVGYRRVYLAGLVLFTLASAGCAMSHTLHELTIARVVQGVGGAGIMAINGALVRFTFPNRMLGRGIGLNAVVVSLSAALGPSVASGILSVGPWPWLFAVIVPLGFVTVLIGWRSLPFTRRANRRFDWISGVLNALTFGLLIYGAESTARNAGGTGVYALAGGVVAGVLLLRRELSMKAPLVPLDLMRIPVFRLSVATSILSFAAQMLAFVALPFFFQNVLHRSVVETGLLMTPWPLAVAVSAPIAGRPADRLPVGILGAGGLAVFAIGLALLALIPAGAGNAEVVWRMMVCGLGFGFFQSPNNRAMIAAAPRHRSGAAGGMLATARLLGQTAGATGMAILFHLMAGGATQTGLVIACGLAACAAVVSSLRGGGRVASPEPKAAEIG